MCLVFAAYKIDLLHIIFTSPRPKNACLFLLIKKNNIVKICAGFNTEYPSDEQMSVLGVLGIRHFLYARFLMMRYLRQHFSDKNCRIRWTYVIKPTSLKTVQVSKFSKIRREIVRSF